MRDFGNRNWTEDKLDRVGRYLPAFTTALKHSDFHLYYVDAFAGSGWMKYENVEESEYLPGLELPKVREFSEGSALRAIAARPQFDRYVFIEKHEPTLNNLRSAVESADRSVIPKCSFVHADANEELRRLPDVFRSGGKRAVLFLDPFGAEVDWATLETLAQVPGFDVWYLFPTMFVQRAIRKDGQVLETCKDRLDRVLGDCDWRERFVRPVPSNDLFEIGERFESAANPDAIEQFVKERLDQIFPGGTGDNAVRLRNTKNSTMFSLFFAMSNPDPKARELAMRIANHILKG
jgi:three-Cys-motif partner protein